MTRTRLAAGLLAVLAVGGSTAGCAAGDSDRPAGDPGSGEVTGELVVFAAASLTEAFTRIGRDFEDAHPGVSVTFNFAGSSTLAQQIDQGAPADVFASANPETMTLVAGAAAGQPAVFASNELVIAVAAGNPHGIAGLAELADPELRVGRCAERGPCGAAGRTERDAAGVTLPAVTVEQDVRAALTKGTGGEVDAALVYRTDVAVAGDAGEAVGFPEALRAVNDYAIVALRDAPNPSAAQAFVAHVLSDAGQAVLADAGFLPAT